MVIHILFASELKKIFLVILFLNEVEIIYLYTSIAIAIVFTQLDGFNYDDLTQILIICFKYCYSTLIILFNTIHSFAHNQIVPSIVILYQ